MGAVRGFKPLTNFPVDDSLDLLDIQRRLNDLILELQTGINKVQSNADLGTINYSNSINQQVFMFGGNDSLKIIEDGIQVNDTIEFVDSSVKIYVDGGGNLTFVDKNNTAVTLTALKNISDIYWSFGSAYGVKFANAAGTEKMIGLMEDADGITYFDDTSEVE